jgi:hypothetical protein
VRRAARDSPAGVRGPPFLHPLDSHGLWAPRILASPAPPI